MSSRPRSSRSGFEWQIDGDDNRNASVAVSYRKKGDQAWHEGLPLLRIGNERLNENAIQYVTPNMLAGSIFDLEPGTEYECRFVLSDPDGVAGKSENLVTVRTRAEPKPADGRQGLSRVSRRLQGREAAAGVYRIDGGLQHRLRRIPITSILIRRASSPATSSWCMPASIRTIISNTEVPGGTAPSDGTYYLTHERHAGKAHRDQSGRRWRGDLRRRRKFQPVQCDGGATTSISKG